MEKNEQKLRALVALDKELQTIAKAYVALGETYGKNTTHYDCFSYNGKEYEIIIQEVE